MRTQTLASQCLGPYDAVPLTLPCGGEEAYVHIHQLSSSTYMAERWGVHKSPVWHVEEELAREEDSAAKTGCASAMGTKIQRQPAPLVSEPAVPSEPVVLREPVVFEEPSCISPMAPVAPFVRAQSIGARQLPPLSPLDCRRLAKALTMRCFNDDDDDDDNSECMSDGTLDGESPTPVVSTEPVVLERPPRDSLMARVSQVGKPLIRARDFRPYSPLDGRRLVKSLPVQDSDDYTFERRSSGTLDDESETSRLPSLKSFRDSESDGPGETSDDTVATYVSSVTASVAWLSHNPYPMSPTALKAKRGCILASAELHAEACLPYML